MKQLLFLLCFLLLDTAGKAQDITGSVTGTTFDYQMVSATEHRFTFQTYFNFGYQATCPTLINPTFSIVDGTLYVKGYYDITGAWPASFCSSFDTVTYAYELPATVTHIITSTNVIGYNNTPPYVPSIVTYENVYTRTFDISLGTPDTGLKSISVSPNPTKGDFSVSGAVAFDRLVLTTSLGQIVSEFAKNELGVYSLPLLENGLYYVTFYSSTSEKVGVCKLINQN